MSEPVVHGPWPKRRRRRRRDRAARRRGFVMLLPSLLTTGNLAAGFWSITLSMHDQLERAALAIVIAAMFDALDGRVARLAKATSRFGAEYDSIADTVSFGVAPAILAYSAGSLPKLGWAGWVLAFIYMACAALRLARFNVSSGRYEGRFDGLPSPAAAGMMLSSVWFGVWLRALGLPVEMPAFIAGAGVALVGFLMVSPIPYYSGKSLPLRPSFGSLVSIVLIVAVLMIEPYVTFFLVGIAYVASGPIEWYWRRRTGRPLAETHPSEDALAAMPGAGQGETP